MRRSWRASVPRGRPEPGLRVWECSTDSCWKQRHITDTLYPICGAIRQYVHPVYRRPTMRPCSNGWSSSTGVRTRGPGMVCTLERMLQTLFTSQTTKVTASRGKTECAKTGLLNTIWSMTMTNELLILQPISVHILYPSAKEHSPWDCCIFYGSVVFHPYVPTRSHIVGVTL